MIVNAAAGVVLLACAWGVQAACPTTPGRFVASGAEVTDSKTGLVWARCTVGQTWDGTTCSGTASAHTHEQALTLAQVASGWRLPSVKELTSIADKGCQNPAIDIAAFPSTPSNWHWSSSPYAGGAIGAWAVGFRYGYANGSLRSDATFAVRLVRASQ